MEWPEITKDTSVEEIKRIHQQIWDYVFKYGEKPVTPYKFNCAACEYASRIVSQESTNSHVSFRELCANCPINWGNTPCEYSNSLYSKWMKHKDEAIRAKTCVEQIRDIPFKYEEERQ